MPNPKKPIQKKMLSRTARKCREIPKSTASALTAAPRLPRGMSKAAAAEWKSLMPMVIELGTISGADLRAFELLCVTLATATEAEETIKQEGLTVSAASGGTKAHPAIKVMECARSQAANLLRDFGLTPKSRAYVAPAGRSAKGNPFDEFDGGNRFEKNRRS